MGVLCTSLIAPEFFLICPTRARHLSGAHRREDDDLPGAAVADELVHVALGRGGVEGPGAIGPQAVTGFGDDGDLGAGVGAVVPDAGSDTGPHRGELARLRYAAAPAGTESPEAFVTIL